MFCQKPRFCLYLFYLGIAGETYASQHTVLYNRGGGGWKRHLPRVSDIDDVKQKNKNHETIPSIF